jgi:probable rRNA maturation factor
MDITIEIDAPYLSLIQPEAIRPVVVETLALLKQAVIDSVSIVITDNETVQTLNEQYRGIAAPTDVLSFANEVDPDFPAVTDVPFHLGDIIIAGPVAQAQALAANHTPGEEIKLLVSHGLLHLLGFDHDTPDRKATMWATQQQVLTVLGLGPVQPTES